MPRLEIAHFGPIRRADLRFGDLTVLIGPQATGKSIALQAFRLLLDSGYVADEFRRHGLQWSRSARTYLELYFGEGARFLKSPDTRFALDGGEVEIQYPLESTSETSRVFYIPAQRVLALRGGWPRPFSDYSPGDPFVVRDFSERLRLILEGVRAGDDRLLGWATGVPDAIRGLLRGSLFADFTPSLDRGGPQKRLVLVSEGGRRRVPFMTWSSGQREVVPLLVALFWLLPAGAVARREGIEWVMIEEPEMGLHPGAISAVLLLVLELLRRGYKVCISTHSQHVLDLVWALGLLKRHRAGAGDVLELFGIARPDASSLDLGRAALDRSARVFFFDSDGDTHDISGLDPASLDSTEASWGGLGEFSGRVAEVVARVVAAAESGADR